MSSPPQALGGPVALVVDTAEFAGAELYLVTLVEQLNDRVDFVAIVGDDAAEETRSRLAEAGAELREIEGLRRRPSPRGVRLLARELRRLRPAVVHANLAYQGDGLGPLGAGFFYDGPMVATLHLVVPERSSWREWISRGMLGRFHCVIAVSGAVERYLERKGVRRRLVLNGLRPTAPDPDARTTLGLDGAELVVGGIGRLHEQKGWDVLCRAAPLVRRELPHTIFAVVGEGPERQALVSAAECSDVRFVGYRPRAAALLQAFDVVVVPSRYEGFGLVALDALFHGIPVVATRVEALQEVLGDCAVLVPPDDPVALADGIVRAASDPKLRADLISRGRTRAEQQFSADRMAEETLAVYRFLATTRAARASTVEGA